MPIKSTTQVGNKIIRSKSKLVVNSQSKATRQIITDLVDSMRHYELVGMAAPQIGRDTRIFVTEIRSTKLRTGKSVRQTDPLRIFINPKIISVSKKEVKGWEGCGSVASANLFGMVKRPTSVTVEALNEKGERFQVQATNLLARVVQHEIDHLNGIVFTDTADPKTYMSKDEYLKIKV